MFSSKVATQKVAETKNEGGGFDLMVDLKLDPQLEPLPVETFQKQGPKSLPSQSLVEGFIDGKTYVLGSGKTDDQIYYPGDLGLFGCVFEAWKNHWVLRTSPEDWWFPIACKISKAVDSAAASRFGSDKVRQVFVNHEGKKDICIDLPVFSIHEADYNLLFEAFGSKLASQIKVPEFVDAMQNDFSTSTPAQTIASQINLMGSLQEFFSYRMGICGCGLRGLEMLGSVADWENLANKLQKVRATLEPIEKELEEFDIYGSWLDAVLDIFKNLAKTRKDPNDPSVASFWVNILMDTTGTKWVGGGGSMPGKPMKVKAYNGWFVRFLTNKYEILAEDIEDPPEYLRKQLSGWNSVPMKISLKYRNPVVTDESTLIAGMIGYVVQEGNNHEGVEAEHRSDIGRMAQSPSIQPHHMWAMLLPPNSQVRD